MIRENNTHSINDKVQNPIFIECHGECANKTSHTIIVGVSESYDSGKGGINYQIVQCNGCKNIFFRKTTGHYDMFDAIRDEEDGSYSYELYIDEELYPMKISEPDSLNQAFIDNVPPKILKIYHETIIAMSNKLLVLTSIGLRALIEAVCKEKDADGEILEDKIHGLVESGVITHDNANRLHEIRSLGNKAAHEIEVQTEQQLKFAINIVEYLFQEVYISPKKFNKIFNNGLYEIKIPKDSDYDNAQESWKGIADDWCCPACDRNKKELVIWSKISSNWQWDIQKPFKLRSSEKEIMICQDCLEIHNLVRKKLQLPKEWVFMPKEMKVFITPHPHQKIRRPILKTAKLLYESLNAN